MEDRAVIVEGAAAFQAPCADRGCSSILRILLFHIADNRPATVIYMHMLDTARQYVGNGGFPFASHTPSFKRAAVDPNAAVRRSVPKPLSILASTDMAAVWVQAI